MLLPLFEWMESLAVFGSSVYLGPALNIIHLMGMVVFLGAILITAYLGGAVATHVRVGSPLFSHILFGVYVGIVLWAGLWLRDSRIRALLR